MKTKFVAAALAALAVLSGCATSTPEQQRAAVDASADWELCYTVISGRGSNYVRDLAAQSIRSRRVDCNAHLGMVSAKLQAEGVQTQRDAAALSGAALGLQMMNSRPAVAPPTTCRTVRISNTWDTVCQ
jgi:hypothetical protein